MAEDAAHVDAFLTTVAGSSRRGWRGVIPETGKPVAVVRTLFCASAPIEVKGLARSAKLVP
jgi:hypothetical protein